MTKGLYATQKVGVLYPCRLCKTPVPLDPPGFWEWRLCEECRDESCRAMLGRLSPGGFRHHFRRQVGTRQAGIVRIETPEDLCLKSIPWLLENASEAQLAELAAMDLNPLLLDEDPMLRTIAIRSLAKVGT